MKEAVVKPIYSITPFSMLDYPDHLSCIIWFARCNMKCLYCYNPEIVNGNGVISYDDAISFLKERVGLLDAVVLSGGECTVRKDIIPFIEQVKALGFKIKIDTNGSRPDVLQYIIQRKWIDFVALDFKALEVDYYRITKNSRFDLFEHTLHYLIQTDFPFEVRTTVHANLLSVTDLNLMANFLNEQGYMHTYFLQAFKNEVSTIGDLPSSMLSNDYFTIKHPDLNLHWR